MNDNKPFLTEDDADKAYEISTCTEAIDYYSGFRAAAEKANARIAELEAWSKKQNDFIDKLGQENQKLREERDRFAIDFAKHFYLLTPTQRCTVHPPAGSGAGYGLYQRDISDILEQFKQQSK